VGHTKVLPQLLGETRDLIAAAWPNQSDQVPGAGPIPGKP
jgi:hypothetical protein